MIEKLKTVPPRKATRVATVLAALIALVWAGLSRGLFDGVTLSIAIAALGLSALQLFQAKPKLVVGPRSGDLLVVRHDRSVRPFDKDAITGRQVAACHEEMPRQPKPEFPPASPLVTHLAGVEASRRLEDALSGVGDDRLRQFLRQVTEYSTNLRDWLDAVDEARADRVRVFEGQLRIRELGQAPGDHVRLKVRFPDGFGIDDEPPLVRRLPHRRLFDGGSEGSVAPDALFKSRIRPAHLKAVVLVEEIVGMQKATDRVEVPRRQAGFKKFVLERFACEQVVPAALDERVSPAIIQDVEVMELVWLEVSKLLEAVAVDRADIPAAEHRGTPLDSSATCVRWRRTRNCNSSAALSVNVKATIRSLSSRSLAICQGDAANDDLGLSRARSGNNE